MDNIKRGRGRPKNRKNTPKTINVPLSKLNEYFKETTLIEISTKYISLLNLKPTDFSLIEDTEFDWNSNENEETPPQKPIFELIQPKPKISNE